MPTFDPIQLPHINPLLDLASVYQNANRINAGRLAVQGAGQDLADRAALRGMAGGLAQRDPMAMASAAALPGVGGPQSILSLANADAQTAAAKLNLLQFQNGMITLPQDGGGSGIPPGVGSGSSIYGSGPTGIDQLAAQIGGSEAKSPSEVNGKGYSGQFQFGAARLADLKNPDGTPIYSPGNGENLNANQWAGTFNIPGFPDVKTHDDFLKNPQAQRAAFGVHVAGIDQAIAQTPGAEKFDQNGLRAVAHLGGIGGMRQFVQTGGAYNPQDSNNTHLSDYYQKFAAGGPALLQQAFGHPEGPLSLAQAAVPPAPSAPALASAPQLVAQMPSAVDDGTDDGTGDGNEQDAQNTATIPPVQIASADGSVHMPLAVPVPAAPAVSPVQAPSQPSQSLSDVLARLRTTTGQPPNQLAGMAAPGSAQNQLAPTPAIPTATAPQQQAPQQAQPVSPLQQGPPPGTQFYRTGPGGVQFVTQGMPSGYALARVPDGKGGYVNQPVLMPGAPPALKSVPVGKEMLTLDERSGNIVNRQPIPEVGRAVAVQVPGGTQMYMNGHPVGDVVPFSGREQQAKAYENDLKLADSIVASGQQAQAMMPRLNEMADIARQLATGPTAPIMAKAAAILEGLGVPHEAIQKLTNMSSGSAAQEFVKLNLTAAGAAAKADVGSNNGIESVKLYQSANPGLNLLPDANKRITNMMRVAAQATQDYAQGALQHFETNENRFLHPQPGEPAQGYTPLTSFNRKWQQQNNPQVYAAATGILNGDPFDKWAGRLQNDPAGAFRAVSIAARIDPNVIVPGKGGGMIPATAILSHPAAKTASDPADAAAPAR